jgi:hypothetical protein
MRALTLGGVAGPIVFASVVLAAAAGSPGYSHMASFISSLESRGLTGLWQRLMLGTLFLWCGAAAAHAFRLEAQPAAIRRAVAS